eukprot:2508701-Amphidinium_carterae.2
MNSNGCAADWRLHAPRRRWRESLQTTLKNILDLDQPWDAMMRAASSDECSTFWAREVTEKLIPSLSTLFLASVKTQEIQESLRDQGIVGAVDTGSGGSGSAAKRARSPVDSMSSRRRISSAGGSTDTTVVRNKAGKPSIKAVASCNKLPCPEGKMHQCSICKRMGHSATQCWEQDGARGEREN